MIVEFVGSTGAGKTTLISHVRRKLAEEAEVATASDLVMSRLGLHGVANPTLQNLIQDSVGLPYFVWSLRRHRAFLGFGLKVLTQQLGLSLSTLNYARSIVRKIGTHEIMRRSDDGRIILVDEGTLLSAHLLFVYTSSPCPSESLEEFARLVPLPDLVVHVTAPVACLVQRSLQRVDSPREIRCLDPMLIERYVSRADKIFGQLAHMEGIRDRALTVDNPTADEAECSVLAGRIAAFILSRRSTSERICPVSGLRSARAQTIGGESAGQG